MSRGNQPTAGTHWLDRVERAGNALPHPVTLFAMALGMVMVLSQVAAWAGWAVRARRCGR